MSRNAPPSGGERIEALVAALDALEDPRAADPARELVQGVLEMHGAGLTRMLEIVAAAGAPGQAIVEALAIDDSVRSLLLLHGLHPDDLATRARNAVDKLRASLGARTIVIELVAVDPHSVRVKLEHRAKGRKLASEPLRQEIETALFDHVPEVETVVIEGLPDPNVKEIRFVPRATYAAERQKINASNGSA